MSKKPPKTKILFAASECAPLCKTGGLADVVGTLPKYLNKLGFDARIILPYHRVIKEKYAKKIKYRFSFTVKMGWRERFVGVHEMKLDGVKVYLIENEEYFSQALYMPAIECEQYGYFTRAFLEAMERLDFVPDILHLNDWHTALAPLLIKTQYADTPLASVKTLLTIHNIAYQGLCDFQFTSDWMGISDEYRGVLERYGDRASFLKAGCVMADRVNTVSPYYAAQITTPEYGEGLDGILRSRGAALGGIVNGIDRRVWNPETDPLLPANFSADDLAGKELCKQSLTDEFAFSEPERPLISMVTRLAEQKGITLVMEALDELITDYVNLLILGNGEAEYESFFREAEHRYKGHVKAYIGYDESLSHRIYAGSDFFLMPSRFEPCGISQMIAMRCGTVPIVRATGGLKDTVQPYNQYDGTGDGFVFDRYAADDMLAAIRYALDCYRKPEVMAGLIKSGMSRDFGCEKWAADYAKLYEDML